MKFNESSLNKEILKSLAEQKYINASPIQEQAIPHILEGHDVLGCAQTGTGKTCAFAAPMIHQIMKNQSNNSLKGLILAPTRELAIQIYTSIKIYAKYTKVRTAAIYGGVKEGSQKITLSKGVDILVATPGRLLDFVNQKVVNLKTIEYFVLDEADRMLDMGFIPDVKKIITKLPTKRQTLLFSATLPPMINDLCENLLNNPVHIKITPPTTTVNNIDQQLYYIDQKNKISLLIDMLKQNKIFSALVFSRTKHGADRIKKELTKAGINSAAIHGDKSQSARQVALSMFKQNKVQVLVATDIASRGIDINDLSHVINFDLPDTPDTYIHRIGRTARAGRSGIAITFCSIDEISMVKEIEKTCKIKLDVIKNHEYEMKIYQKTPPKVKQNNKKGFMARVSQKDKRGYKKPIKVLN